MMLAFLAALCSCSTTRYVEVPKVSEVIVYGRDSTSTSDSVFVHDSISVVQRGDTVYKEKFKVVFRDRWRERLRIDSLVRRDSVAVVVPVPYPTAVRGGCWSSVKGLFIAVIAVVLLIYPFWPGRR